MSRILSEFGNYDWCSLGSSIWFDGPDGNRFCGVIVRTSLNQDYFHVKRVADGKIYEVSLSKDRMSTRMDP